MVGGSGNGYFFRELSARFDVRPFIFLSWTCPLIKVDDAVQCVFDKTFITSLTPSGFSELKG